MKRLSIISYFLPVLVFLLTLPSVKPVYAVTCQESPFVSGLWGQVVPLLDRPMDCYPDGGDNAQQSPQALVLMPHWNLTANPDGKVIPWTLVGTTCLMPQATVWLLCYPGAIRAFIRHYRQPLYFFTMLLQETGM